MRRPFMVLTLIFFIITGVGCTGASDTVVNQETIGKQPIVYSSFYPLYDFAKQIGGSKVIVKSIVPLGAEPHGYEPSARNVTDIAEADVLFYIGMGLEGWIDKVITSIDSNKLVVRQLSDYVETSGAVNHDDTHLDGKADPHIWLDPVRAKKMVKVIADTLVSVDPENEKYYRANYKTYAAKLDELHQDFKDVLRNSNGAILITTHDAFGYLANRYGLETYSIMGISANAEPTSGQLVRLVNLAQEHGVKAIYSEELLNSQASQVLAQEAKVEVLSLSSAAGLTKEQLAEGQDYISLMYQNLNNLKRLTD